MKYKNTKRKINKLWNKVKNNEIKISDLEKLDIKQHSILYQKGISNYSSNWFTWRDIPSSSDLIIIELENFPERIIPYIRINLINKTTEAYVDKLVTQADEIIEDYGNSWIEEYWDWTYVFKKEQETENAIPKYYIIVFFSISFWEYDESYNVIYYPLDSKLLITINNSEELHELITNKK